MHAADGTSNLAPNRLRKPGARDFGFAPDDLALHAIMLCSKHFDEMQYNCFDLH